MRGATFDPGLNDQIIIHRTTKTDGRIFAFRYSYVTGIKVWHVIQRTLNSTKVLMSF